MKKYGIVLMLAAAFLSGACDKMGLSDDAVSYEPTWAAVYDYPVSKDDCCGLGLLLVQGRTDDELFSFTSPGAALSLQLCVSSDTDLIPEGVYSSSTDLSCPSILCPPAGSPFKYGTSFVAERLPDSAVTRFYSVTSGLLKVNVVERRDGEKVFLIEAEVEADGRRYKFDYRGPLQDFRDDE